MRRKYNINKIINIIILYYFFAIVIINLISFLKALSTSSAFADRLCVATNGDFNQLLSAEELTFCCHKCGYGCNGGYPIKAWERFKKHGLVTGGDYKSGEVSR